jgi:glycosyltransferase involved in cell wall biosynthesis
MSVDLSVFIPVYNAAEYVDEAIESVLAQTGPSFELLVVDDGSTDGSWQKLVTWSKQDSRIRLLQNERNQGVSHSANLAIDAARGGFLVRLDADDVSLPNRHSLIWEELKKGGNQIVGSGIELFGDVDRRHIIPVQSDAEIKANFMLCAGNILNPASAFDLDFVRRNQIRYREYLQVAEDLNFWIDCMVAGARFINIPEVLVRYRIHPNQSGNDIERLKNAQFFSRHRLFQIWYPDISVHEAEMVATLMGAQSLQLDHVDTALQVIDKLTQTDRPSVLGENQNSVMQYLSQVKRSWLALVDANHR